MRRAAVTISIKGHDVTLDLMPYLVSLTYTDKADEELDDLQIVLEDREGLWQGDWLPQAGDIIEAGILTENWREIGAVEELPCGKFEVDEMELESSAEGGDTVTVKAVPAAVKSSLMLQKKTRSWEKTPITTIIADIAGAAGLDTLYRGPELVYERVEQRQESDLEFMQRITTEQGLRLLRATFSGKKSLDLGAVTVDGATDFMLMPLCEVPSSQAGVAYTLGLPDGTSLEVAEGQAVTFATPVTGDIGVTAVLDGSETWSPVLWPGTQALVGVVQTTADYYGRSIAAKNGDTYATKAVLIYDALVPSGAAVKPEIQIDGGAWQAMPVVGTTRGDEGVVEFRCEQALSNAVLVKLRFSLTGASGARPIVGNIRFMAVVYTAYLTKEVSDMLRGRLSEPSELVFPSPKGGKQIIRTGKPFLHAVKACGFNDGQSDPRYHVVFHSLRHTYASLLVQRGVPLTVVSKLMGHATTKMTERYAKLSPDNKKDAANLISEILSSREPGSC